MAFPAGKWIFHFPEKNVIPTTYNNNFSVRFQGKWNDLWSSTLSNLRQIDREPTEFETADSCRKLISPTITDIKTYAQN